MPRGSKEKYTEKEKRQAEHIEKGYEERGTPKKEAVRGDGATVNKVHHGGEKPGGGGYGKSEDHSPMRKGGRIGGKRSHIGIRGQGSGVRGQGPGVRNQESGVSE